MSRDDHLLPRRQKLLRSWRDFSSRVVRQIQTNNIGRAAGIHVNEVWRRSLHGRLLVARRFTWNKRNILELDALRLLASDSHSLRWDLATTCHVGFTHRHVSSDYVGNLGACGVTARIPCLGWLANKAGLSMRCELYSFLRNHLATPVVCNVMHRWRLFIQLMSFGRAANLASRRVISHSLEAITVKLLLLLLRAKARAVLCTRYRVSVAIIWSHHFSRVMIDWFCESLY